jgi:hypothetical protein
MRKGPVLETWGTVCRKEFRILGHLADGTYALCNTPNDNLREELQVIINIHQFLSEPECTY